MHDILKIQFTCSHENMTLVALCNYKKKCGYESGNRISVCQREHYKCCSNFLFPVVLSLELTVFAGASQWKALLTFYAPA